jgi:hypothetical protein
MIVVAKGRGFIIAIIAAGYMLLSDFVTSAHFHDNNYYAQHRWPKLSAFFAAACTVWWMTHWREDEVLAGTYQTTARQSILRERDSLFFISAKYWPGILLALGIASYFVRE